MTNGRGVRIVPGRPREQSVHDDDFPSPLDCRFRPTAHNSVRWRRFLADAGHHHTKSVLVIVSCTATDVVYNHTTSVRY